MSKTKRARYTLEGKLGGAGTKPVSAQQMELAGLRAKVARLNLGILYRWSATS